MPSFGQSSESSFDKSDNNSSKDESIEESYVDETSFEQDNDSSNNNESSSENNPDSASRRNTENDLSYYVLAKNASGHIEKVSEVGFTKKVEDNITSFCVNATIPSEFIGKTELYVCFFFFSFSFLFFLFFFLFFFSSFPCFD